MELNVIKNFSETQKNFKFNLKRSYQFSLFEVLLLIIVIAIFYFFILSPKKIRIKDIKANVVVLQEELSSVDSQVNVLKALGALLRQKEVQLGMLDEALPLDNRITKLEILLSNIAAASGVTTGDITFSSESEQVFAGDKMSTENKYKTQRVLRKVAGNIYVIGTFQQLKGFLKSLEESGRVLNSKNIEISASSDDKFDMRILLEAYYFSPTNE